MTPRTRGRAWFAVMVAAALLATPSSPVRGDDDTTRGVTAQRAAFNEAIHMRRFADLEGTMLPEFTIVAPGPGAVTGAARNIGFLERLAARRPDLVFRFSPERIDGYTPWGTANESGTWVERWAEKDGPVELRGRYFASWIFSKGAWRQQALIFSPTACTGGTYCGQQNWDDRTPAPRPSASPRA